MFNNTFHFPGVTVNMTFI